MRLFVVASDYRVYCDWLAYEVGINPSDPLFAYVHDAYYLQGQTNFVYYLHETHWKHPYWRDIERTLRYIDTVYGVKRVHLELNGHVT